MVHPLRGGFVLNSFFFPSFLTSRQEGRAPSLRQSRMNHNHRGSSILTHFYIVPRANEKRYNLLLLKHNCVVTFILIRNGLWYRSCALKGALHCDRLMNSFPCILLRAYAAFLQLAFAINFKAKHVRRTSRSRS
jgi:hypothetical protein